MEDKNHYQIAFLEEIKDLPEDTLPNLLQIIRLFKESILKQRQTRQEMEEELQQWDQLSDEALMEFEKDL